MEKDTQFETPMMKQYIEIKKDYPDCLLFFRLGDFYELFMQDAEIGSKIMEITLTARNKGKDKKISMCGVPFHAIDSYLAKVIKAGYKAAICEQTTEPKPGKEIVEREVIRIVTPGTINNTNVLDSKSNNYTLTFNLTKNGLFIAYADITTGEFSVLSKGVGNQANENFADIINEIKKINPSEIVLNQDLYNNPKLLKALRSVNQPNIYPIRGTHHADKSLQHLLNFFKIKSLNVFGLNSEDLELITIASQLLSYLEYTQKGSLNHIKKITNLSNTEYLKLDPETMRNLEIFDNEKLFGSTKKENTFFEVIDFTLTPMGGRLLKRWIYFGLTDKAQIQKRQNYIQELVENHKERSEIRQKLEHINDIERLLSRLGTKTANARDVVSLKQSIKSSLIVNESLVANKSSFQIPFGAVEKSGKISKYIENSLKDDPPVSIREGDLIKNGVNIELDGLKNSIEESKIWIESLEKIEREKTGISNLKVGFNSVFGYYIEISKSNTHNAPTDYIRKQTLVNAERYITQELKIHEEKVLSAREQINKMEYEIFMNICSEILKETNAIQTLAIGVAEIDVFSSLAELAIKRTFVKPMILEKEKYGLAIKDGRHPVVEVNLGVGEFVPNSIEMNENGFLHLITGPNMAGKSTYIRQIALIQILAQIGSFIPATEAKISIVDGIYTRIGAGDALSQGLSTFMVEMIETAKILNNATRHSLIILDEVGRGTSTLDGLCIARAVTEYIHNKIKAKTLFATHFHELVSLEQRLKKLKNFHVRISEEKGEIRFLHKLALGGTDKSYGIDVAKLAGIPEEVIKRATELLEQNNPSQLRLAI